MSIENRTPRVSAADVTVDLERRLRTRYQAPAYAYLPQVGDSTGYSVHRHADAIVMSLWPSRGLHLMGFEIKAGLIEKLTVRKKQLALSSQHSASL